MTLDEACQILNVKNERLTDDSTLTNMLKVRRWAAIPCAIRPRLAAPGEGDAALVSRSLLALTRRQNYDHLFKANGDTTHFLQSKIVRAKDRIEAEIPFGQHSSDSAASPPASPPPS